MFYRIKIANVADKVAVGRGTVRSIAISWICRNKATCYHLEMRMKRSSAMLLTIAIIAAQSVVNAAGATELPRSEVFSRGIAIAARQAHAEHEKALVDQISGSKAVPRTDKLVVDVIGTIAGGTIYEDDGGCGYAAGDLLVLFIRTKGQLVSVACTGAAFNVCNATRPGQRLRVQGTLVSAPDVLDADFDECDSSTWIVGPINFLFPTKITK
jgi:hypothetical protein